MEHSPHNSDPKRKYHQVLLLVDYKDLRVILETQSIFGEYALYFTGRYYNAPAR